MDSLLTVRREKGQSCALHGRKSVLVTALDGAFKGMASIKCYSAAIVRAPRDLVFDVPPIWRRHQHTFRGTMGVKAT